MVVCLFVFIFWPSSAACGDLSSLTGDRTRASSSGSVVSSPPGPPGKCLSFVITKGPAALPLHLQCGRPGFDSLGQEDPLEEGMATHSSILAWRIPWTEEPGGLQSMGSQRARHEPATEHTHWENVCICRSLLLPLLLGAYPHFLGAPSLYFWPDPSCFLPLHTEGHVIHSQPELKPSASLVPIPHESKLVLFALCRGTGQGDASGKGTVVLIGISETMCSPLGTHSSASLAVTPQIPAASAPPEPGLHAPRRPVSRTAICPLGPGRTWGCGVQSPFFLFFFTLISVI